MSDVIKHVQIPTTKIGDSQVTERKFNEHFEHGEAVGVTSTPIVIVAFDVPFAGTPNVVVGIMSLTPSGTANSVVVGGRTSAQFIPSMAQPGTADISWIAWGPRA